MKFNKFTVAIIASAIAMNAVYAEEITFAPSEKANNPLIAACPSEDCPQVVTPKTKRCPKCHKRSNKCKCNKQTNSYNAPKQDCEREKVSTSSACPVPNKEDKASMMQSYAYPNAIYGTNQKIGEKEAGIYIGDNERGDKTGIPVAREKNAITGAAACIEDTTPKITAENNNCDCQISMQTEDSIEVTKKTLEPFEVSTPTGAAAPLVSAFEDVPAGYWAGCDINKLTENNIIAGYPDRTFKPNLPVSRAEMAALTVKGYNLLNSETPTCTKKFKDVPKSFWGNSLIKKAVANGLMDGYPNNTFKPNKPVTRAEAFSILAKGINCPMDLCQANEILSKYCDADSIPEWAKISIAKAIQSGALNDSPKPDMINANKDASRAEIASMLENIRVSLGYSNTDKVTQDNCGCTGAAAYIEHEETLQLPTIAMNFNDEINAKSSNVGDRFAATTTEDVTINGETFPTGSTIRGRILEVQRSSKNQEGSLKLAFDTIEHEKVKADLPQQVLSAQVEKKNIQNPVARLMTMPFTLTGSLLGTVGRTVGGAVASAGNAVENVVGGVGIGTGEVFQGQFKAAGRSYGDAIKNTFKAPIDATRTALSGTMGLFQTTGDEIAYLVDAKGTKISSINPKEKVTVAFGCKTQQ